MCSCSFTFMRLVRVCVSLFYVYYAPKFVNVNAPFIQMEHPETGNVFAVRSTQNNMAAFGLTHKWHSTHGTARIKCTTCWHLLRFHHAFHGQKSCVRFAKPNWKEREKNKNDFECRKNNSIFLLIKNSMYHSRRNQRTATKARVFEIMTAHELPSSLFKYDANLWNSMVGCARIFSRQRSHAALKIIASRRRY